MAPHRPFDPSVLDAIEESVVEWRGKAYRQVFEGTDVLRANIRGARWNPPEVEALYCSLQSRTAAAEIDHLINRQPVPIRTPRLTQLPPNDRAGRLPHIVMAATNHPRVLDRALFRRFDDILHFEMPDESQIAISSPDMANTFSAGIARSGIRNLTSL